MKKLIGFIVLTILLIGLGIGVYFNETKAKYYEYDYSLEYGITYISEDKTPETNLDDLFNSGVKVDVHLKYNDSEKGFAYVGKQRVYKKGTNPLTAKYYVKIRPISKYSIKLLFA